MHKNVQKVCKFQTKSVVFESDPPFVSSFIYGLVLLIKKLSTLRTTIELSLSDQSKSSDAKAKVHVLQCGMFSHILRV